MYDPHVLHDFFHYRLHCAGTALLSEILVQKFGAVPPDIADELRHCHEFELLEDWVQNANAAESIDAFRDYILHVAPTITN